MKQRARRVVIGAAALGVVLVAVLAITNWGAVGDHAEAWHFQLTRETSAIEPGCTPTGDRATLKGLSWGKQHSSFAPQSVFDVLTCSGHSVIHDLPEGVLHGRWIMWPPLHPKSILWADGSCWSVEVKATDKLATRILRTNGYRVLEQRFPRRAYVVIRDARPMWIEYPGGSPHNGTERP